MKVYISADMEGVTGVSHWEEVDHNKSAYTQFQKQMSLEVAAACEGAIAAGADDILTLFIFLHISKKIVLYQRVSNNS